MENPKMNSKIWLTLQNNQQDVPDAYQTLHSFFDRAGVKHRTVDVLSWLNATGAGKTGLKYGFSDHMVPVIELQVVDQHLPTSQMGNQVGNKSTNKINYTVGCKMRWNNSDKTRSVASSIIFVNRIEESIRVERILGKFISLNWFWLTGMLPSHTNNLMYGLATWLRLKWNTSTAICIQHKCLESCNYAPKFMNSILVAPCCPHQTHTNISKVENNSNANLLTTCGLQCIWKC